MSEPSEENPGDGSTEPGEDGDDLIDESGRNPTQQRMDAEGTEAVPVDTEWEEGDQ